MKRFAIPEAEIIYFVKKDIIITSTCKCVACAECPETNYCECDTFCVPDSDGDNVP